MLSSGGTARLVELAFGAARSYLYPNTEEGSARVSCYLQIKGMN